MVGCQLLVVGFSLIGRQLSSEESVYRLQNTLHVFTCTFAGSRLGDSMIELRKWFAFFSVCRSIRVCFGSPLSLYLPISIYTLYIQYRWTFVAVFGFFFFLFILCCRMMTSGFLMRAHSEIDLLHRKKTTSDGFDFFLYFIFNKMTYWIWTNR